MPIQEYDFNFDRDNLEIFPCEIWQDQNIVFHGTSVYHSDQIERAGFIPYNIPFNPNDVVELIRVLQLPEIAIFDRPNRNNQPVSRILNHYIEINGTRLSFAYLSYLSAHFATGQLKGGQTLGNIRRARTILQDATQANLAVAEQITEPINRLFDLETNVANTNGVVYAVRLEAPYDGIIEEYGIIHSVMQIAADRIIGKVVLPNDIELNEVSYNAAKLRNVQKLRMPNGLGKILHNDGEY